MIKSMPRDVVVSEIRRAERKAGFMSLSDRIDHEANLIRLRLRLTEVSKDDPRIEKIYNDIIKLGMGVRPIVEGNGSENIKLKMILLSQADMDQLWFVYENAGAERVAAILLGTYQGMQFGQI